MPADFKFIILHSLASVDSEISNFDNLVIQGYRFIKRHSLSTEEMYGLELANVEVETVPIMVGPVAKVRIKREKEEAEREKELKYHQGPLVWPIVDGYVRFCFTTNLEITPE